MPANNGGACFQDMSRKWLSLAERQLAHLIVLYRSGRWERYFVKERFVLHVQDAIRAVNAWRRLAGEAQRPGKDDLRPAA